MASERHPVHQQKLALSTLARVGASSKPPKSASSMSRRCLTRTKESVVRRHRSVWSGAGLAGAPADVGTIVHAFKANR